ncbi:MAG: hypothetical protein ABJN84_08535 [Flavobacteriaceae bacterium]
MENLKSFGVQELNAKEITETDGGFLPLAVVVAIYLLGPLGTHKAY